MHPALKSQLQHHTEACAILRSMRDSVIKTTSVDEANRTEILGVLSSMIGRERRAIAEVQNKDINARRRSAGARNDDVFSDTSSIARPSFGGCEKTPDQGTGLDSGGAVRKTGAGK